MKTFYRIYKTIFLAIIILFFFVFVSSDGYINKQVITIAMFVGAAMMIFESVYKYVILKSNNNLLQKEVKFILIEIFFIVIGIILLSIYIYTSNQLFLYMDLCCVIISTVVGYETTSKMNIIKKQLGISYWSKN